MRNNIAKLSGDDRLFNLPGSGVVVSPAFEVPQFVSVLVDSIAQRIGGLDTTVFIRIQQSNDGVNWVDPPFVGVLTTSATTPRPRNQTSTLPGFKFVRVTWTNNTANPTNIQWCVTAKTNS